MIIVAVLKQIVLAVGGRVVVWWMLRGLTEIERHRVMILAARRLINGHVTPGHELDHIRADVRRAKEWRA